MTAKAERWEELVRAWRQSGQTARAFAAGKGISESSLRWWAGRQAKRAVSLPVAPPRPARRGPGNRVLRAAPEPTFARVVRPGEAETDAESGVTVVVGAFKVTVQHGFNEELLRDVIRILGGSR